MSMCCACRGNCEGSTVHYCGRFEFVLIRAGGSSTSNSRCRERDAVSDKAHLLSTTSSRISRAKVFHQTCHISCWLVMRGRDWLRSGCKIKAAASPFLSYQYDQSAQSCFIISMAEATVGQENVVSSATSYSTWDEASLHWSYPPEKWKATLQ